MFALVNFILLFLIILILIGFTFVVVKKNQKHNNYLKKITNVFYQIRYGNLNTSLTGAKTKLEQELENVINSSIESISDRDNMIQEHIEREREMAVLKSDFIAALTHDLKVPVIAHDKTFDLLLDNKFGELTPEQNEAIKNLKTSNMDLKYLIEALLETYKLEQTKLVEDVTYGVNVPLFIHEVISMIEPIAIAHNKKIDLIVSTTDDFTADIDKFLIKRVLQNLILNGLNHSVNSDFIEVTLKAKGENFQIDIKDSGSGIDEEEIEHVAKCTNLDTLFCNYCFVETSYTPLKALTGLKTLYIDGGYDIKSLSVISNFTELENLSITCTDILNIGFVKDLKRP